MNNSLFYIVFNNVKKALGLKGVEKDIFFVILGYSQDGSSWFFGGQKLLADIADCNERTVQRAIKNLKERGLIRIQPGIFKECDSYQVVLSEIPDILSHTYPTFCTKSPDKMSSHIIKDKINKEIDSINTINKESEEKPFSLDDLAFMFEDFRSVYKGTKRGHDTEFENLKKHHDDWKEIVPTLLNTYYHQEQIRDRARKAGLFVSVPKNLQTYINQRCWEEDLSGLEQQIIDKENGTTTGNQTGNAGNACMQRTRTEFGNPWEQVANAVNGGEDILR